MLAAAFANRFTKLDNLVKLYEQVQQDKIKSMKFTDCGDGQNAGIIIGENYLSLQAGAEASINLLESSFPECLNLLYFLGCLPGGVSEH